MSEAFLVIDAGSGSVKSFLISPTGEILARSEREWNRDNWRSDTAWTKIQESVTELMKLNQCKVLGISSTSMREEFVLLDENGKEVSYVLSEGSEKHGYKTLEAFGEAMYLSSGHWPVPNWIAGALLPWLQESGQLENAEHMLMISDWVNYKLCGEIATEGSSSCETSLYNIRENDWSWKLIDSLGLPREIFPDSVRNGEIIGYVPNEVSDSIEITEGTPVVIGGADTQCGLLGMGVFKGQVGAVGGTTTPVQVVIDEPLFDPSMKTWTNNYLFDNLWILESNVGYTGSIVRWIRDEKLGTSDYVELNSLADRAPVGSDGVLSYLGPHLFDNSPPYWSVDKLGDLPVPSTIIGKNNDISCLTRSVIEANCYGVKANLNQLQDIVNLDFDYLWFCGGNSKSDLWMQIQADVLGMEVRVPMVHDATAVGVAILCGLGTDYFDNVTDAVVSMVRIGKLFEPRRLESEAYQSHYRRWMETRDKLSRA